METVERLRLTNACLFVPSWGGGRENKPPIRSPTRRGLESEGRGAEVGGIEGQVIEFTLGRGSTVVSTRARCVSLVYVNEQTNHVSERRK